MNNPHENHRQRTLETYLQDNVKVPEHILLEMLLYYSIPRKNTNEIAHSLISSCGSLAEVLNTPPEQLVRVCGIGQHSANLIRLTGLIGNNVRTASSSPSVYLKTREQCALFLVDNMKDLEDEALTVLSVDQHGRVISFSRSATGNYACSDANLKEVLRIALNNSAESIVVGHNHRSGNTEPSDEDVMFTLQLRRACDCLCIKLQDHVIVSSDTYSSVFDLMEKFRKK